MLSDAFDEWRESIYFALSAPSRARITIEVTSGKPRGKTVKAAAHQERAFPPSPRNLISSNVIPEIRLGGGATICIRALESLDSDFQLAARRRREGGRGGGNVEGSENGGGCDVRFSRLEREGKRERLVEVSSPWIVPAIIYFLSDRGDRLYGGCSVQAPGSGGLSGSAYLRIIRTDVQSCFRVWEC